MCQFHKFNQIRHNTGVGNQKKPVSTKIIFAVLNIDIQTYLKQ